MAIRALPLIAGGAAACGAMAWAVRGRSSQVFGDSVWRGPKDRRAIALTFDDGPSEGTPRILDVLESYGVPATFFQVGMNVERLPAIARDVRDAGHEIGNHSQTHPYLFVCRPTAVAEELERAQHVIEQHTGEAPRWFRAPYGVRWFGVRAAQRRFRLRGVMWTIIGYDWSLTADAVVKRLAARVVNGAILCLHDGRELQVNPEIGATVDAVRNLVPRLLDQGYEFETVGRLLCPTN
jgi:peptidoglycan/xylan/chitin deacetylase (PgdA/CDA1 family)